MKHQVWDWIEKRDVNLPNIPLHFSNAQKTYNEKGVWNLPNTYKWLFNMSNASVNSLCFLVLRVSFWNVHNNLLCKMKVIVNLQLVNIGQIMFVEN
jgi:hypothetical protein